ncbi:hypothetical protein FXO38_24402 [Capsicum annuum]|nr:hypothetical protein FXO38_24402 [Capsicum annuum]
MSQATEMKNKSFQNYEKLVMLYGKHRATRKYVEIDSNMLKRNAHKNPRKLGVDSFTIDKIDEVGYKNTDSLEDIEAHELGDQSQETNDAPTPNVYSEAPAPTRNKKSKHEHLKCMTGILRGGMENLAGDITGCHPFHLFLKSRYGICWRGWIWNLVWI